MINYFGKAIYHPLQPDSNGNIMKSTGEDMIKHSIQSILSTPKGSMFFNENYGSSIDKLRFEQNDAILFSLLRYYISLALFENEKRIKVYNISFELGESIVYCKLIYLINDTKEVKEYIYPFTKVAA